MRFEYYQFAGFSTTEAGDFTTLRDTPTLLKVNRPSFLEEINCTYRCRTTLVQANVTFKVPAYRFSMRSMQAVFQRAA